MRKLISKNKTALGLLAIFMVVTGLGLGIYFLSQESREDEANELQLSTTIFPVADIAKNIAGDKAEVNYLLPAGVSEHTYEPTINDKQKLADADLLFIIGAELDEWALPLAEDETVKIVDLSKSVTLKEYSGHEHEHEGEEKSEEKKEDDHAEEGKDSDPHYWLSVANGKLIAATVRDELIAIDSANKAAYEANYNDYVDTLTDLEEESKTKLASLKGTEIITFHDAFAYFAADYDLEIVTTIEPFPGQQPTAQYLAEVGVEVKEHDIKVLYKEPQLSESIVSALAKDYGVKVFTLDPVGGVDGRDSYVQLIRYNVDTIYASHKN